MSQPLEILPAVWSEVDERFFAVVTRALPAAFLLGAGVLLASYDDEVAPSQPTLPRQAGPTVTVPEQALPR